MEWPEEPEWGGDSGDGEQQVDFEGAVFQAKVTAWARGPEAGAGLARLRTSESGWNRLSVGAGVGSEVRQHKSRGVVCADSYLNRIIRLWVEKDLGGQGWKLGNRLGNSSSDPRERWAYSIFTLTPNPSQLWIRIWFHTCTSGKGRAQLCSPFCIILSQPIYSLSLIILLSIFFPLSSLSASSSPCCLPFSCSYEWSVFLGHSLGGRLFCLGEKAVWLLACGSTGYMRRVREQIKGDRHSRCLKRQLCHEGHTSVTGGVFVAWSEFS